MGYENVELEIKDHVAVLAINHPPANAVNLATLNDFNSALDEIEKNTNVRVLVVTGKGEKGFCAGFDVSDAANGEKCGVLGQETWTRVSRLSIPVIAALNGFALGGGCELALACHFRVMVDTPKAKIGLTELNLGIIPGWGGTQRMMQVLGKKKAMEMILFSKKLSASEAFEAGLVDKLSTPETLMNDVMEMANFLSGRPPLAVKCVLRAMLAGNEKGIDEGLKVELEGTKMVMNSADAVEGFTAFFEKRTPVFKGE
ncbi:MAG: enoyl-CoA hydratase/isomerase family protein [Proteobacteria bacterium]|nr:enoyl-CoA hydratase/isomerase family protein [Pseudomonadota bacterium]